MRDEIEGGEFLEDAHGIGGAQNGDGAGEADFFGARSGRGENDGGSGVEKLFAMMLADAEDVEADLVGEFDFFEQMLETVDRLEFQAGGRVGDGRCETVDADFHETKSDDWARTTVTLSAGWGHASRPASKLSELAREGILWQIVSSPIFRLESEYG